MERRKLVIYTEEPDMTIKQPDVIIHYSYKDTADAIIRGDPEVHTLQLAFLNHQWIKAGYDIILIDKGYECVFDETYLNFIPQDGSPYGMLDLYKWGNLYKRPDPPSDWLNDFIKQFM